MPPDPDPAGPLRAHFQRERDTIDRHPSPEQIVAYHERRLPPGEAEGVREHLAACPDCTAQLLELAALLDAPGAPVSDLSRTDLDAAWQRQRARLFPAPPPPVALAEKRGAGAPLRWAWATAASMGLAAALLAFVVVDQRQTIARLAQPRANPPLVNLDPVGSARRGFPDDPELRLPKDGERVWVILNPASELDLPAYDVEVAASDGEVILRFEGLRPSEASNFRLEIPAAALAPGEYRILLIARSGGRREAVEEFALKVR
jgi:hypothetical protein